MFIFIPNTPVLVTWGQKLMTEGPPEGKEQRRPELYFDSVLEGSRLVAERCAKDVIFP